MRPDNKPVFVVFEGLDGSGKSACAKRTAELLGAAYLKTPSGPLLEHRECIVSSFADCQEAAQLLYLASVANASWIANNYLEAGQSIVLDRYLLSTQVYADFRGSTLAIDDVLSAALLPADLTVFLDSPLAVRRKRIKERSGVVVADDSETLSYFADASLSEGYRRRFRLPVTGKVLEVDSFRFAIDEIASIVSAELRQLRGERE